MNVINFLMLGLISLSPTVFPEMPGGLSPVSGAAHIQGEIPANGKRSLAGLEETALPESLSAFQEKITELPIIVADMEDQEEDEDEGGEDEGDGDEEDEEGGDEEEEEDTE